MTPKSPQINPLHPFHYINLQLNNILNSIVLVLWIIIILREQYDQIDLPVL